MTPLAIVGIGVCATGMENWTRAQSVLLSDVAQLTLEPLPRLAPECLPPVERRRANATARLAISAAMQAIAGMPQQDVAQLAAVFSSSDGDGEVLASMLAALAQPQVVLSPTLFHNSVFNAPAGYWSIGSHAHAASTTVSAGTASFAAGLREAHGRVLATGAPVLYVAYDAPFPTALASFARSPEPFACALRLAPMSVSRGNGYGHVESSRPDVEPRQPVILPVAELCEHFAGNSAADALPLLFAIAGRRRALIALPDLDGAHLRLDYLP